MQLGGGEEKDVALAPGEGVIWSGDCVGEAGTGEGGVIEVLVYR